jgi:hypothetical protein
MTTEQKLARRKRSLLELATELGNVSKACRVMGYSRQQFYEIRRNFQTYGADGLLDRWPAPARPIPTGSLPRSSRRSSTMRSPSPATARCASPRNSCCAACRSRPAACAASGSATAC